MPTAPPNISLARRPDGRSSPTVGQGGGDLTPSSSEVVILPSDVAGGLGRQVLQLPSF
jgi:hypothetical protein